MVAESSTETSSTSRNPSWLRGDALFSAFLILATLALSLIVLRQRSAIADLESQLQAVTEQVGRAALPVGESLAPLDSFGLPTAAPETPEQTLAPLAFADGRIGTVLFIHDGHCGACESIYPRVAQLADIYSPKSLRFVAIQLDAKTPDDLVAEHHRESLPLRGVPMNQGTWLRRVPLVPGLFILDYSGTIRGSWHGALTEDQWAQATKLLDRAASGWK